MSMTDSLANTSLDALLGAATLIGANVYIGLLLSAPNPDGTGVIEPTGGAYSRVAVVNDATHWPAASGRMKTHASNIVFPTATADWGEVFYAGVFSAISGAGTLRLYDLLIESRIIKNGDLFDFVAGSARALKIFA